MFSSIFNHTLPFFLLSLSSSITSLTFLISLWFNDVYFEFTCNTIIKICFFPASFFEVFGDYVNLFSFLKLLYV